MEKKYKEKIKRLCKQVGTFIKWYINFCVLHTYTKCGYISTLVSVRIKYLLKKRTILTIQINLLKIT